MFSHEEIIEGTKHAIDHLLFASYQFNRKRRPDISPESLGEGFRKGSRFDSRKKVS
jgi:hypothetical protein